MYQPNPHLAKLQIHSSRFELCQAQIGGLQQVQSGLRTLMSTNILVTQAMTTPSSDEKLGGAWEQGQTTPARIAVSDSRCMGLVAWVWLARLPTYGQICNYHFIEHVPLTLEATFEQCRVRHLSGILGVVGWILACHHDPNCNLTAFTPCSN